MSLNRILPEAERAKEWAAELRRRQDRVEEQLKVDIRNELVKHVSQTVVDGLQITPQRSYERTAPKRYQEPDVYFTFQVGRVRGLLRPVGEEVWFVHIAAHHQKEGDLEFEYEVPGADLQNELLAVVQELNGDIEF